MARPISLETVAHDPREELRKKLEAAPDEHAEALLESYEVLQELHDKGLLQLLRGALSAGNQIIDTTVEAVRSDEAVRGARNMIVLAKMLGCINPEILEGVAIAVADTLGSYRKPVIEPPGLLSLLGQFRHKELRRSVALINRFLESLGNQISLQAQRKQREI